MFGEGVSFGLGVALAWTLLCIAGIVGVVLVFYTIVGIQSLRANMEYRKLQSKCEDCGKNNRYGASGLCGPCIGKRTDNAPTS